jgi:hypothetical protein
MAARAQKDHVRRFIRVVSISTPGRTPGQESQEMAGCLPEEAVGEELYFITFLYFLNRPV